MPDKRYAKPYSSEPHCSPLCPYCALYQRRDPLSYHRRPGRTEVAPYRQTLPTMMLSFASKSQSAGG